MRIGTSYFKSHAAALRYYSNQFHGYTERTITEMVAVGEIHIGKPEIKPGQRLLLVDNGTRYAIEEDDLHTYQWYMEDCNARHQQFYWEVAKSAGVCEASFDDRTIQRIMASVDPNLNDIELGHWDTLAANNKLGIAAAIKARGSFYAMSTGVCAMKAAARHFFKGE